MTIKDKLRKLGKTQNWLITKLNEQNVHVSPADMSLMLNGILKTPKAEKVLPLCEKIIESENRHEKPI